MTTPPKTPQATVGTKELVANFSFSGNLTTALDSTYGISSSTTCVQWVKVTNGAEVKQISLMADIPYPATGTLSDDAALPFAFNVELDAAKGEGFITEAKSGARVAAFAKQGAGWSLRQLCTDSLQAPQSSPVQGLPTGNYHGCELMPEDGHLMQITYYFR